jgi:predicted PurR-regulated permease PerM
MTNHSSAGESSELENQRKAEAAHEASEAAVLRSRRPHLFLQRDIGTQEMFALAGGFGLFSFLLVTLLNQIIHPIFPLAGLVFFLYPFRHEIVARRTMQLGIIAFFVWLSIILSGALFPFIFAFLLAYLASPLLSKLAARGIPRWATALTIVLLIVGVYAIIGIFVIPRVIGQFDELAQSARGFLRDANSLLDREKLIRRLTRYGLTYQQSKEIVTGYIEPQIRETVADIFTWMTTFIRNASSILEGIFTLILIPMLSFYLLLDFPRIRTFVRTTLLQDHAEYVYFAVRVDEILSAYLRGILLTSSMVSLLAIGILSAFNVPYSIVIGLLTGFFNLIPTIGMFLTLGVAMLIYLFAPGDFWLYTLITAGMIAVLHAFNSYFVEPRFLGHRVGLHPVVLIASLFIFGHFLGFIGLLIAVPATAVILMFIREWYERSLSTTQPVNTTAEIPK